MRATAVRRGRCNGAGTRGPPLFARSDGRVFIHALRKLKPGEELFYDYGLVIDERYTPKLKKEYACRCGSPLCRGTMLAPKR